MVKTCGHCGREIAGNFASYNGVQVCNPESGTGEMECYVLIRDFHHEFSCHPCRVMGGTGVKEAIKHEH